MLCVSVVLIVQALLFADGGITALGTNIVLMAVVTTGVGWLVFRAAAGIARNSRPGVVAGACLAGMLSVPASAAVFVALYEVGGTADIPFGTLMTAMLGWHVLIGLGEAAITALTVSSVLAVRPDLVYGARRMLAKRRLEIRSGAASEVAA